MDKRTEKRLGALKAWRGPRAEALKLDPGVLCPNAALESIALASPENVEDLKGLPELKTWFVREFGEEIIGVLERHASDRANDEGEGEGDDPPAAAEEEGSAPSKKRSSKRSGRRSSKSSARRKARSRSRNKSSD
jgi:ribonuclease D